MSVLGVGIDLATGKTAHAILKDKIITQHPDLWLDISMSEELKLFKEQKTYNGQQIFTIIAAY